MKERLKVLNYHTEEGDVFSRVNWETGWVVKVRGRLKYWMRQTNVQELAIINLPTSDNMKSSEAGGKEIGQGIVDLLYLS